MRRVAIFGSGGQLGVELKAVFAARGWEIAAFERSSADITDAALVERTLAAYDPQLVINAAAYNQVDVAEKEPLAALQINGLAVRNLAMAALAAALRILCLELTRISNDLRLLCSGPLTGIAELVLPAVQPGSTLDYAPPPEKITVDSV